MSKEELQNYLDYADKFIADFKSLEQENRRLKEQHKQAIEYIKPYRDENINWYEFTIQNKIELLKILGDKE